MQHIGESWKRLRKRVLTQFQNWTKDTLLTKRNLLLIERKTNVRSLKSQGLRNRTRQSDQNAKSLVARKKRTLGRIDEVGKKAKKEPRTGKKIEKVTVVNGTRNGHLTAEDLIRRIAVNEDGRRKNEDETKKTKWKPTMLQRTKSHCLVLKKLRKTVTIDIRKTQLHKNRRKTNLQIRRTLLLLLLKYQLKELSPPLQQTMLKKDNQRSLQ
jgi:hypothetical protein